LRSRVPADREVGRFEERVGYEDAAGGFPTVIPGTRWTGRRVRMRGMSERTPPPPFSPAAPPAGAAFPRGVKLLHDPIRNKGTAFTDAERDAFGLRGLLPPRVMDMELQVSRVLENLRAQHTDLDRYLYLVSLQDRNEHLFYRLITENLEEILPIVYTPTVGQACQQFGQIFRRPRGLYVSARDRGRVEQVLRNWPHQDVRMVVATDGARILGLGDLGAQGMGIPIGKLVLYTACAGIHPTHCLPVTIDVGTDNEKLRRDPLYIGLPQPRLRGAEYDELIEELVAALGRVFPHAVLQFEDFATANAFGLLRRYRDRICCFNDDIQGTAAVALAGLYSAGRLAGKGLTDQRLLLLGAGEAGIGISDLVTSALVAEGLDEAAARQRCWLFDSQGLVTAGRERLAEHKRPYAHEHAPVAGLAEAVRTLRPTALIGVSGATGAFDRKVLEAMAEVNESPIVFALSNPTSKSECTAREAVAYTHGRAIFASGSPFPPVDHEGRILVPGQGNNAYIFPGLGLGIVATGARRVTDEMFFTAARTLAAQVTDTDLTIGRVFPSLQRIREVSAAIAVAVAEVVHERGLAAGPRPDNLEAAIREWVFVPEYRDYVGEGEAAV
jgi:malate dehydrogenase (oxaloacetate-decarboxylating)(NADP+)